MAAGSNGASWKDQLRGKAPLLGAVMGLWVVGMLLVGWFAVRPLLTKTTVTGNVVMTYFVAPSLIEQMGADLPDLDTSLLIPKCEGPGFRVNIRDGSGRIVASPVGVEVQTRRTDDDLTYTLECTTVFTATVPKSEVYRISTVLGETNPENPDYRAEATIQLSEMEDGQLPVLRMAKTVPDLG